MFKHGSVQDGAWTCPRRDGVIPLGATPTFPARPFIVCIVSSRGGEPVIRRLGDFGELVGTEGGFEVFDLCGAEDTVEEDLGEDIVSGELGRAFVSA